MQEFISYFKNKKNLVNLLVLAIMVLAVPLGVNLARQQQILKSQAGGGPIAFVGDSVKVKDGKWTALKSKITLQLTSDLGPPIQTGIGSTAPITTSLPSLLSFLPKGLVGEVLALQTQGVIFQSVVPVVTADDWVQMHRSFGKGWNALHGPTWIFIGPGFGGWLTPQQAQTIKDRLRAQGMSDIANQMGAGQTGIFSELWRYVWEDRYKQVAQIILDVAHSQDNQPLNSATSADQIVAMTPEVKEWMISQMGGPEGSREWSGDRFVNDPVYFARMQEMGFRLPLENWPNNLSGLTDAKAAQFVAKYPDLAGKNPPGWTDRQRMLAWYRRAIIGGDLGRARELAELAGAFPSPSPSPVPSPSPAASPVSSPSPAASPVPSPSPSPSAPPVFTKDFRLAESKGALEKKDWVLYTESPMEQAFEFEDKTPGPKKVCVQFRATNGQISSPPCVDIRLLGEDPAISSCSLNFEGSNVVFDIKGKNFGATKGSAKSGETALQIKEWKDTSLKLTFPNAPVGQSFPISLTNVDEQVGEGTCSAFSTISLGAKVFCRAPSSHDSDNVEMILVGLFEGAKKTKETVKIDRNGNIANLTQRLEEGKKYMLSLKAPRSLRRVTEEFTASSGTTNIPNFTLPVGDIFPTDGGDGKINTLDKAELNRQWIAGQSASGRSGDFNLDSRVNSIDWACMRYDFGQEDASEPLPGMPAASPVPSPSPSSSPSPSPSG